MFDLLKVRQEKGISIAQLSHSTQISTRTLEDIERRGDAKFSTAILISQALNTDLNEFYTPQISYKYHILDASVRNTINLENYGDEITNSAMSIFPNIAVTVYPDYFEIKTPTALALAKIREMGKIIVESQPELKRLVKEYNYTRSNGTQATSHQLFKRFF